MLEDHEAFYSYYKHGPLARTILGQQQVQGVDYAYTLQGWLKGVNAMALDTAIDMGRDGGGTITARDAYGFQLNYFTGDYKPVNTVRNPFPRSQCLHRCGLPPALQWQYLFHGGEHRSAEPAAAL